MNMPMPPRDQPFLDYRAAPSRATLTRLLEAEQHGVFNVCFHVIRHRADAEDAAQEVLVRAVDAAAAVTDAGHWRRWLIRASVNAALDAARGRQRRAALAEGRAAMEAERGGAGLSDDDREALGQALASLEDDDRALVAGHFLDRVTLEDLGRERGISAPAIWKRLERAKERLRTALASAGCLAALPRVDAYLEVAAPEAAARNLVGGPVAARLAAAFGGAAGVGLGEVAMATKVWGAAVLVLAALLAIGIPAVLRARARSEADPGTVSSAHEPAGAIASSPTRNPAGSQPAGETPPRIERPPGEALPAAPLNARLAALRTFMDEIIAETGRLARDMSVLDARNLAWKKVEARYSEFRALREDVLAHPAEFLEYLSRPGADRDASVLVLLLTGGLEASADDLPAGLSDGSKLPAALADGLLNLAHRGLPDSRVAALRILSGYVFRPASWDGHFLALLEDSDARVQEAALAAMWTRSDPLPAERFETLRKISESSYDRARADGLAALAELDSKESRDYLRSRMASDQDPDRLEEVADALAEIAEKFEPDELEDSLRAAVPRALTEGSCRAVAGLALRLPPPAARRILLDLWKVCTDDELRDRLDAVARSIEGGEIDQEVLKDVLAGRK